MTADTITDILISDITNEGLLQAYKLITQLRKGLSIREFIAIYQHAKRADQYTLVAAYQEQLMVGLIGYRVLYDYVHGKHLYIDDLVVSEWRRSKGIGAQLLSHAEDRAKIAGCNGVRLSTGISNHEGIKFYEREGWQLKAHTFKKGF